MLGTYVAIEARVAPDLAVATVEAAYAQVQQVGTLMHPTQTGSDLARLGAAALGTPVSVNSWTFEVLRLSQQLNLHSEGLFDPCLPARSGRMPDLELRAPDVIVCRAPVMLDLGGIAKGFAVDQAVEELLRRGCLAGVVNAGGDLRVFGAAPRTIHASTADGNFMTVELRAAALAASSPRTAASPSEHRGFYLGTSGAPVDGHAVAIIAPSAAVADALCICALVCPPTLLAKLLEIYGARLAGK
jgi:thiamine biosynthesis lipoprotein